MGPGGPHCRVVVDQVAITPSPVDGAGEGGATRQKRGREARLGSPRPDDPRPPEGPGNPAEAASADRSSMPRSGACAPWARWRCVRTPRLAAAGPAQPHHVEKKKFSCPGVNFVHGIRGRRSLPAQLSPRDLSSIPTFIAFILHVSLESTCKQKKTQCSL